MNLQISEQKKRNYETLPDLLNDLRMLITNTMNEENEDSKSWETQIDCGGDYHSFSFGSESSLYCYSREAETVSDTYENFETLMLEFNHVKEFMENEDFHCKQIRFIIIANGGSPFIRITCSGDNYDDNNFSWKHELNQYRTMFIATFITCSSMALVFVPVTLLIRDNQLYNFYTL